MFYQLLSIVYNWLQNSVQCLKFQNIDSGANIKQVYFEAAIALPLKCIKCLLKCLTSSSLSLSSLFSFVNSSFCCSESSNLSSISSFWSLRSACKTISIVSATYSVQQIGIIILYYHENHSDSVFSRWSSKFQYLPDWLSLYCTAWEFVKLISFSLVPGAATDYQDDTNTTLEAAKSYFIQQFKEMQAWLIPIGFVTIFRQFLILHIDNC